MPLIQVDDDIMKILSHRAAVGHSRNPWSAGNAALPTTWHGRSYYCCTARPRASHLLSI